MSLKLQAPRGTYDALPAQAERFRRIEYIVDDVCQHYGYGEIRTPIFEFTDIFTRPVGEATDIVSKEMYTFEDKGGESLSLRPENTAAVIRAFYSNGLKKDLPLKLYYNRAPMFRYERPQKGRYRQFHQMGAEIFGIASPWADVEVIALGISLLKDLGLGEAVVKLNSLGTSEDRQNYREKLRAYFEPFQNKLSEESQRRLKQNPLRILDSKEEEDQPFLPKAPRPLDHLGEEAEVHFTAVKKGLKELDIKYEIDTGLVRGLDYYTHTVFEIHGAGLGAQSQVLGGGRYDGLFKLMGGDDIPAVGFAGGMERMEMLLADLENNQPPVVFICQGEGTILKALQLAEELRAMGVSAHVPLQEVSMKAQFKRADKLGAKEVVIIGENELQTKRVQVKDMESGEQMEMPMEKLVSALTSE